MLAVEPHSISTVPLATSGMRVAEVTGLYATLRLEVPSLALTACATGLPSSVEKTMGCHRSSRYDNGIELSRWPMVKVPVSLIFFKVPSRSCAFAGAHAAASKLAAAAILIAFFIALLLPPVCACCLIWKEFVELVKRISQQLTKCCECRGQGRP